MKNQGEKKPLTKVTEESTSRNQPCLKPIKPRTNTLFRGDNLAIMRALPDECVDLIYIDPPFFTQRDYKNIWGDRESVTDFEADFFDGFKDTKDFFERHIQSDAKGLKAYLEWMRARLVECHRILAPKGNFFIHIDYHASHYLKVILDEIFGSQNFRNEIVWRRKIGSNSAGAPRRLPANTDSIFYYSKSNDYIFNPQYRPHDPNYVKKFYRHDDKDGRGPYSLSDLGAPSYSPTLIYDYRGWKPPERGWRYCLETMKTLDREGRIYFPENKNGRLRLKRYFSEMKGTLLENIWDDIGLLQDNSKEKTGWPTQKPVALLERIIKIGSNEGDIVFDCFAGCGTTMMAAHNLKRKWIGIDISPTAAKVNKKRLEDAKAKVDIIDEKDLPCEPAQKQKRVA